MSKGTGVGSARASRSGSPDCGRTPPLPSSGAKDVRPHTGSQVGRGQTFPMLALRARAPRIAAGLRPSLHPGLRMFDPIRGLSEGSKLYVFARFPPKPSSGAKEVGPRTGSVGKEELPCNITFTAPAAAPGCYLKRSSSQLPMTSSADSSKVVSMVPYSVGAPVSAGWNK
ncbi:hypothetical protein SAMN05444359_14039 [Neolewinella agarilytica]|uniref:Uncharacterized protein n=1 Tax=Neolewinella agarilytica TaxID=478744 RepID=A0A1H9NXC8_9BACT|nr:hypothetical protein SAMN05444359_14039 [Neolewinella agarilytica]